MSRVAIVTGATGFIAQHLVKILLASNYKVVGTVRSDQKGQHLKTLFGANFSYAVVANFVEAGAFDEVLQRNQEAEVFFHTASPVSFGSDDIENTLLKPAIEGTLNALKAVQGHGKNIKRFVLTSSYATLLAIQDGANHPINEDSWNPITYEGALANGFAGYAGSKTLGEQAAWKFVEEEKPHFSFTSVLPPYVFGPQAFDSEVTDTLNLSSEFITQFLKLQPNDKIPEMASVFADVRDVAKAHFLAGEKEEAAGKRICLSAGKFVSQTILNILRKNFPQLQETVPKGNPASEEESLKTANYADFSKTEAILQIDYIDFEKTVTDTVAQVLSKKK